MSAKSEADIRFSLSMFSFEEANSNYYRLLIETVYLKADLQHIPELVFF